MKANRLTRETIGDLGKQQKTLPAFQIGDAVAISQWITEGNKKRLQMFEGDVIAIHNNGASSTFTVRKIGANNVAVERIFPYYSPVIETLKVLSQGEVCRAKLYYMRDRIGKHARVKEKVLTREQKELARKKLEQA